MLTTEEAGVADSLASSLFPTSYTSSSSGVVTGLNQNGFSGTTMRFFWIHINRTTNFTSVPESSQRRRFRRNIWTKWKSTNGARLWLSDRFSSNSININISRNSNSNNSRSNLGKSNSRFNMGSNKCNVLIWGLTHNVRTYSKSSNNNNKGCINLRRRQYSHSTPHCAITRTSSHTHPSNSHTATHPQNYWTLPNWAHNREAH
ncbi:hypothetical protein BGZ89_009926 [Linnemannia elongata]|nr:hypothetical protein BGZ89_009926 [Linnemannia elongata]